MAHRVRGSGEEVGAAGAGLPHRGVSPAGVPDGEVPLAALGPGQSGEVVCVHPEAPLRQRLLDLGLVPGTRVDVLFASPLGDPVAYRVRGATIALRAAVASSVRVRRFA